MASFEIVEMTPDGPVSANLGVFPNGKLAASVIPSLLSAYPDKKFQPRPIKDDTTNWRERELQAMAGRKQLAWDLDPIVDHFAHVDPDVKENIKFVFDETQGKLGRYTSIHVMTYLHRFYPDLSDDERRKLTWNLTGEEPNLHITQDAKIIEKVYTSGPHSCMAYKARSFATHGQHPSQAYAGPDLAIAYIVDTRDDIIARAVVWPDRQIYGRTYGDNLKIETALKAYGYKRAEPEDWHGARLSTCYIEDAWWEDDEEEISGYLMPYLDMASHVRIEDTDDGGSYAVIDPKGPWAAQSTGGQAYYDGCYCQSCRGEYNSNFVRDTSDGHEYCGDCLKEKGYARCCHSSVYYKKDGKDIVEIARGEYICARYYDNWTFFCPVTNEQWYTYYQCNHDGRVMSKKGMEILKQQRAAA